MRILALSGGLCSSFRSFESNFDVEKLADVDGLSVTLSGSNDDAGKEAKGGDPKASVMVSARHTQPLLPPPGGGEEWRGGQRRGQERRDEMSGAEEGKGEEERDGHGHGHEHEHEWRGTCSVHIGVPGRESRQLPLLFGHRRRGASGGLLTDRAGRDCPCGTGQGGVRQQAAPAGRVGRNRQGRGQVRCAGRQCGVRRAGVALRESRRGEERERGEASRGRGEGG